MPSSVASGSNAGGRALSRSSMPSISVSGNSGDSRTSSPPKPHPTSTKRTSGPFGCSGGWPPPAALPGPASCPAQRSVSFFSTGRTMLVAALQAVTVQVHAPYFPMRLRRIRAQTGGTAGRCRRGSRVAFPPGTCVGCSAGARWAAPLPLASRPASPVSPPAGAAASPSPSLLAAPASP